MSRSPQQNRSGTPHPSAGVNNPTSLRPAPRALPQEQRVTHPPRGMSSASQMASRSLPLGELPAIPSSDEIMRQHLSLFPGTAPSPCRLPVTNISSDELERLPASLFPELGPGVISAVVLHKLYAKDLWILNPRCCDSSCRPKNIVSLITLLENYFTVLITSLFETQYVIQQLTYEFSRYKVCLMEYSRTFKWEGILNYHDAFFNLRIDEMARGFYGCWSQANFALESRYLVRKK